MSKIDTEDDPFADILGEQGVKSQAFNPSSLFETKKEPETPNVEAEQVIEVKVEQQTATAKTEQEDW